MSSRERVMATLRHQEADRVPVDYAANPEIDRRLKANFGLADDDTEGLLRKIGVDFRGVGAWYCGPKLHADIPERGIKVDEWGIRRRWVEHGNGGYWDYCDFPLRDATEEEVARWPMPSPDHFGYDSVAPQCEHCRGFAIQVGHPGIGDIINTNGMLRGMEQTLIDLLIGDPAGLLLAQRRIDIQLEVMRRTLECARGAIDFMYIGEDLGTQAGPMLSLDSYRQHIRPLHQRFVDLAKSFGIPVMIHCCGSSSWAFEDFIDMGITAVDTLQPEAKDMAPEYLKKTYGGRLAFHGCISTAGPVVSGTPEETAAYCRRILEVMMPGGGYCFAPTHQLQDNSPVENVRAMYETVRRFGGY